ncbi:hypothetical protein NQ317_008101 [Molorchus minor]|uniref:Costars domain-containing protein n=1 Tax=Molorchus minor TaxID=1323400 RepID=A0ABQ9JDE2_9CUCU|nr:hypothetical protein NQ317_008101 [Molorchus minor]
MQINTSKRRQSIPFQVTKKWGKLPKPVISKEEYGRPPKGSLSETRGFKANALLCKEMLQLCEIIYEFGEPLFNSGEDLNDGPKVVISFGELFGIYASISNKVVGVLLRARKHKLLEFEGEILFQRRDDDVPIFLMKPIQEIRQMLKEKDEVFDPPEEP